MAQHYQNRTHEDAVELLKENGFEAVADAVTVLMNSAMVAERTDYLGVAPYERSVNRVSYANGYKDKALKTRLATLPVPSAAECRSLRTHDGHAQPGGR